MPPPPAQVRIAGLRELGRALARADRNLGKNLRQDLRDVAGDVATEARQIAESKGLRDTGDLIRGIGPYAVTGGAGVRSSARHGGYPYPSRLEYEGRFGGSYGPRASLNPAIEAKRDDIERGIERVLDALGRDYGGSL